MRAWRLRDGQFEQPRGVAPVNALALGLRNGELPDETDRARLERGERWSIAAIEDTLGAHPLQHHLHRRQVISDGVEVHFFEIMARRVSDPHWRIGAEEERLVLQLISIIHAADGFADASAA